MKLDEAAMLPTAYALSALAFSGWLLWLPVPVAGWVFAKADRMTADLVARVHVAFDTCIETDTDTSEVAA